MVFSNMIMQRIEIEEGGGNFFNNIWIFKKLPNPTLTKDPYHFPARTCCTPARTLTPTRRFPKAALCGFPRLLVPIASYNIFVSFLSKLSGLFLTSLSPVPKCQATGQNPQRPGHVSLCSAGHMTDVLIHLGLPLYCFQSEEVKRCDYCNPEHQSQESDNFPGLIPSEHSWDGFEN